MITVPTLKPGQTPYDPATAEITNPNPHPLPIPAGAPPESPAELTPEEILSHALVKNTLTTLHQEDDEHFQTLQSRTGHELSTLVHDHQTFLNNQKLKFQNEFSTETQKHLFATATASYFAWSLARAENLYREKVHQFHHEAVTRQNEELMNRILSPEALFDDKTQTVYRDMILHNLETTATRFPANVQKERLTTASKTIYRKIIEKRLETDPAQLPPILTSKTVQHAFTPEELQQYDSLAEQAILKDNLKRTAADWAQDGVTKKVARRRIRLSRYRNEEGILLLQYLDDAYFNLNRKKVLATILNAMNVWALVARDQPNPDNIPSWVIRTNPDLHAHILKEIEIHQRLGGRQRPVDYPAVLEFIDKFNPHQTLEPLVEEPAVYSLIADAGGSDSEPFGIILRLLLGSLDRDDTNWIAAMHLAFERFIKTNGNKPPKPRLNSFLTRFTEIRRIRLANQDGKELDELQLQEIIGALLVAR